MLLLVQALGPAGEGQSEAAALAAGGSLQGLLAQAPSPENAADQLGSGVTAGFTLTSVSTVFSMSLTLLLHANSARCLEAQSNRCQPTHAPHNMQRLQCSGTTYPASDAEHAASAAADPPPFRTHCCSECLQTVKVPLTQAMATWAAPQPKCLDPAAPCWPAAATQRIPAVAWALQMATLLPLPPAVVHVLLALTLAMVLRLHQALGSAQQQSLGSAQQ